MPCLGEGEVWRQEGRCPSEQGGEQEGSIMAAMNLVTLNLYHYAFKYISFGVITLCSNFIRRPLAPRRPRLMLTRKEKVLTLRMMARYIKFMHCCRSPYTAVRMEFTLLLLTYV